MAHDTISFACPACATRLTVPAGLVGVTGPCPSCGTNIQAPVPAVLPAIASPLPVQAPLPAPEAPVRSSQPPAPVQTGPPNETAPPVLRREPRQLPPRPRGGELTAKRISRRDVSEEVPPYKRRRSQQSLRLLIPIVMVAVCLGAMVAVVILLRKPPEPVASAQLPRTEASPPPAKEPAEPTDVPPVVIDASPLFPQAAPKSFAEESPVPSRPAPDSESPAIAAMRVLEEFLEAGTIEERLPLMESRTPVETLMDTFLARPMPAAIRIGLDVQKTDAIEQLTDVYFHVDFDAGSGAINAQTMLVRIRSGQQPKVVADPLLDLYGGRLLAYANTRSERGGFFQVIASANAGCYEKHVPNRDGKLTLRLMAHDGPGEICRAYFSRLSKLGEMLRDGSSGVRYAQSLACTVMLRWNTEEDPERPFLEAIDIKSLDWNP